MLIEPWFYHKEKVALPLTLANPPFTSIIFPPSMKTYEHMKTRMFSCHVWLPNGSENYFDWRKAASFDPQQLLAVPRPSASSRDSPARAAAPAILQTSSEPAAAKATGWDTKLTKHLTGPDPPRFGFLPISVKTPAKCPPKNAGIKWLVHHPVSKSDVTTTHFPNRILS